MKKEIEFTIIPMNTEDKIRDHLKVIQCKHINQSGSSIYGNIPIHRSDQISVDVPSPINFINPYLIKSIRVQIFLLDLEIGGIIPRM